MFKISVTSSVPVKYPHCAFSFLLQPSVRKTHCSGRKHKENVKDYYQKWMEEQAQSLIDKTSKHLPHRTVDRFSRHLYSCSQTQILSAQLMGVVSLHLAHTSHAVGY